MKKKLLSIDELKAKGFKFTSATTFEQYEVAKAKMEEEDKEDEDKEDEDKEDEDEEQKKGRYLSEYHHLLKSALKVAEQKADNSGEVKALKSNIEKLEAKISKETTALLNQIKIMGEEVLQLRKSGLGSSPQAQTLKSAIIKEFKNIAQTVKSGGEFFVNAFVNKDFTTRADIGGSELGNVLPNIGELASRSVSLYDIFRKVPVSTGTHDGSVVYYDYNQSTTVRAAEFLLRGEAFPRSEVKFQKYRIDLKKVGDSLVVDEEFFEDNELFYNTLEQFLFTNVDLAIDQALYNGNGLDENIKGILNSVPEFVPQAGTVEEPTIYDLVVKCKEAIAKPYGGKYRPDIAIMNLSTINKYKLAKDGEKNYILPPFVDRNGNVIDGVTVIESNVVADNVMVVGDRKFGAIYEMAGLSLQKGTSGEQFNEDLFTLKVRKRMLFLIREVDKTGFVKVSNIQTALDALAIS